MNINGLMGSLAAQGANATDKSGTDPNKAADDAQKTFLNLLITELKSQDPTSPMDPTQMVNQMLSMNQLNELISINQILQTTFAPPAGSGSSNIAKAISPATQSITGGH